MCWITLLEPIRIVQYPFRSILASLVQGVDVLQHAADLCDDLEDGKHLLHLLLRVAAVLLLIQDAGFLETASEGGPRSAIEPQGGSGHARFPQSRDIAIYNEASEGVHSALFVGGIRSERLDEIPAVGVGVAADTVLLAVEFLPMDANAIR